MKYNFWKKLTSIVLCAAMICSSFMVSFAADTSEGDTQSSEKVENADGFYGPAQLDSPDENTSEENPASSVNTVPEVDFSKFKDAQNHWAKDYLKKAVEDGLLTGYTDGTLKPDAEITLAQMTTIITRILKTEKKAESGVKSGWYKDAADMAAALGLVTAADAGKYDASTTRQRACKIIAEAFQLTEADADRSTASKYTDFSSLSSGDKIVIASMVNQGYIQGYKDSLMLSGSITRSQFVAILYRIADNYQAAFEFADNPSTGNSVITGSEVKLDNLTLRGNLWIDNTGSDISLTNLKGKKLTIRGEAVQSLYLSNCYLDKLVLACNSEAMNLNCIGYDTTVIGSGSGDVTLEPYGNDIEITGSNRIITVNGTTGSIAVSGNNNRIYLTELADTESIVVNGQGNNFIINSRVEEIEVSGTYNRIDGKGKAGTITLNTHKSYVYLSAEKIIDKVDEGIANLSVKLYGPGSCEFNSYFIVNSVLSGEIPEGKTADYEWFMDGKSVKSGTMVISSENPPKLNYYLQYSAAIPNSFTISLRLTYVTEEGEKQTLDTNKVTITPNKKTAYLASTVTTKYVGNRTTQWAINHNYSNEVKEAFVNYNGYSSSSQYLIWVNIATQYCSVFQGSKGNWKLIRSGLVSTGAGDCTPRGVFQTTYKQTNWTTDTYTVKPVVRFYGEGYAFHSRLYYPNTTSLKPGSGNGVGYPNSHGCVRMQADDIQWLYDNVPSGTTVVVY